MAKQILVSTAARIKVIGVGGGGCNAVTRMVREQILGVEFYALNTDSQALTLAECPHKMQIGEKLTRGLGAGGDHNIGQRAGEESRDDIRDMVGKADMVFIAVGMGGGTGTGAAPVVAEAAKETGALVIGIVTRPFSFEGVHRRLVAEEGINQLIGYCDTLIIVPNDRLLPLCDARSRMDSAFKMADDVLRQAVAAIAEVITVPGMINLDYADIRSVMKDAGPAWLSIGKGTGQNRATDAAKAALASPLLDISIEGAKGVLYTVSGGSSLALHEVNQAAELIKGAVDPEANIIFGVTHDPKMDSEVRITLVATGFRTKAGVTPLKPEELRRLLKAPEEGGLDVPSFLRGPLTVRRQQMLSRASQATGRPVHTSISGR
ncbi:MAG: cell division protein FtsZ [Chloroflexi bacterium]|nr:cell division protein FtsZ [Chloroflexota bacterium]